MRTRTLHGTLVYTTVMFLFSARTRVENAQLAAARQGFIYGGAVMDEMARR
jgi:hypothetical protein